MPKSNGSMYPYLSYQCVQSCSKWIDDPTASGCLLWTWRAGFYVNTAERSSRRRVSKSINSSHGVSSHFDSSTSASYCLALQLRTSYPLPSRSEPFEQPRCVPSQCHRVGFASVSGLITMQTSFSSIARVRAEAFQRFRNLYPNHGNG